MKITFSNDEIQTIIQAHAEKLLNVEIDDSEEVTCKLEGYSAYNISATISIEKREEPALKVAA